MTMNRYVIQIGMDYMREGEPALYWSDVDGWTELPSASVYKEFEIENARLPLCAHGWVQLPEEVAQ